MRIMTHADPIRILYPILFSDSELKGTRAAVSSKNVSDH